MLLRVSADGAVSLDEGDEFRRFSIRFDSGARGTPAAEAGLAAVARRDGEAAWVSPDALRRLAPRGEDPAWLAAFDAMVAFARSRGWVDEGGRIRAHVEADA